eukprot:TRINITY_DN30532_c0_g1_i1.p1 TRINITY_DN30532_c0_g1~~TRINITY_DN30532_c0_g1_i1.p1  ORF type:complete len:381 (+),score=48.89 TRINITY_DN30532_c0_g1_i1:110-1252(+)
MSIRVTKVVYNIYRAGNVMADTRTAKELKEYSKTLRKNDNLRWKKFMARCEKLKEEGHSFQERAHSAIVSELISMKHGRVAERIFNEKLLKKPHLLSLNVINSMMRYHAKEKGAEKQAYLFTMMLDRGFDPDVVTFTEVIKCQVLLGNESNALDAYEEAKRRGVRPDAHLLCALIPVLSEQNVEKILKEMQRLGIDARNTYFTASLIENCAARPPHREADPSRAEVYFKSAIKIDTHAFRSLLWVYVSSRDVKGAFGVLDRAHDMKIRLTTDTLRQFVKLCIVAMRETVVSEGVKVQCLDRCVRIYEACPPDYRLSRETLELFVEVGDLVGFRKYLGLHMLQGLMITPTITALCARANLPPPRQTSFDRGNHLATWKVGK